MTRDKATIAGGSATAAASALRAEAERLRAEIDVLRAELSAPTVRDAPLSARVAAALADRDDVSRRADLERAEGRLRRIEALRADAEEEARREQHAAAAAVWRAALPRVLEAKKAVAVAMGALREKVEALEAEFASARRAGAALAPMSANFAGVTKVVLQQAAKAISDEVARDELALLPEPDATAAVKVRTLGDVDGVPPGRIIDLPLREAVALAAVNRVEFLQ